MPKPGYLKEVKALCEQYGALYIADEVQCGLMRSGKMWAIDGYGVEPDIIVTGKGLSGGIYPITAAIMNDKAAKWLKADGSAHMSTFGGSELGCCVALKVMEILQRQETIDNVADISQYLRRGLMDLQAKYSDYFTEIRQNGLIMGLGFAGDQGAVSVMRHLYDYGVWAIYSMLDPKILQFKPVILIDHSYCDELLERMDSAFYCAAKEAGFYRYS